MNKNDNIDDRIKEERDKMNKHLENIKKLEELKKKQEKEKVS